MCVCVCVCVCAHACVHCAVLLFVNSKFTTLCTEHVPSDEKLPTGTINVSSSILSFIHWRACTQKA